MENTKLLKIAIIGLLVLNLSTMAFMWLHKPPMGPPHHQEDTFRYLVHELKFNDTQRDQYQLLRDEHHHDMEDLQKKSRDLHNGFFKLLNSPGSDAARVRFMADAMAENQKKTELLTFDHFKKVRALCTPEQQNKFDDIILDALKRMAPKPP